LLKQRKPERRTVSQMTTMEMEKKNPHTVSIQMVMIKKRKVQLPMKKTTLKKKLNLLKKLLLLLMQNRRLMTCHW